MRLTRVPREHPPQHCPSSRIKRHRLSPLRENRFLLSPPFKPMLIQYSCANVIKCIVVVDDVVHHVRYLECYCHRLTSMVTSINHYVIYHLYSSDQQQSIRYHRSFIVFELEASIKFDSRRRGNIFHCINDVFCML
jgi:hypothetical protein